MNYLNILPEELSIIIYKNVFNETLNELNKCHHVYNWSGKRKYNIFKNDKINYRLEAIEKCKKSHYYSKEELRYSYF